MGKLRKKVIFMPKLSGNLNLTYFVTLKRNNEKSLNRPFEVDKTLIYIMDIGHQNAVLDLKWYCDENHIFPIEPILKHKQVACMTRKMLFTIFKYLFSFQRYLSF